MRLPLRLPTQVSDSCPQDADALGWGALQGPKSAVVTRPLDEAWCARRLFTGKAGQILVSPGEAGCTQIVVGFGDAKDFGTKALRQAVAAFASSTGDASSVVFDLSGVGEAGIATEEAVEAAVEGFFGARYRYRRYHAGDPDPLASLTFIVETRELDSASKGLERGRISADATYLARDLSNEPAADLSPERLAEVAVEVAGEAGLEVTIFDEAAIAEAGLGGLAGVAAGSARPARLIKLVYEPSPDDALKRPDGTVPTVALVGKGITFDSGGLTLKPYEGMITMKTDMSGAANVIAALGACRALGVGVRVVGLAPATENMPGGRATKPGDVLTIRNGKTIEVLNTDCEGRLVLADALSLAVEEEPDAIVDLATLTGACVVALGGKIAGLMGNDDRLVAAVEAASSRAGEATWRLPLPEVYRSDIDSEIADMKNIGKRAAGTITAALLLAEFVADRPWVHLDIAGPSRYEEDSGEFRKGATGFGVRTLLELLSHYEPLGSSAIGAAGAALGS